MSAPIKVTDLVAKSLESLEKAESSKDAGDASRLERRAHLYGELAGAQSAKTANIIAYLNSDRSTWSETDEAVVRVMLGLHTLPGGGADNEGEVSEPEDPTPAAAEAEPESEAEAESAPVAMPASSYDEEPSFA